MSLPVRQRILDAAAQRFYADGIRAVSADRLIADAGVSKVTFYRHFPTKDDLIVAYLEAASTLEYGAMATARAGHDGDAAQVLRGWADLVGEFTCSAGFRGCAFLNAAAEFADATHPARQVVDRHRSWLRGELTGLIIELGADAETAEAAAEQLQMLRDGAMLAGGLDGHPRLSAARFIAAVDSVIARASAER